MRSLWIFGPIVFGLLALGLAAVRAEEETPAAPAAPTVETQEFAYDVFMNESKVGHMTLKVTSVREVRILEEEFQAPFKGKEAGFESQITYRGGIWPKPLRGKVTTHLRTFRLMDGTVAFAAKEGEAGGGESTVKVEATGFADKDGKPVAQPVQSTKEMPVPAGRVLSYPAFLYFAPQMLPEPGQVKKVAYMTFPADLNYPEVVAFTPDGVLTRSPPDERGVSTIELGRIYAGGNMVPLVSMTVDAKGQVVESRMGKYTLRPPPAPKAPKKSSTPGNEKGAAK